MTSFSQKNEILKQLIDLLKVEIHQKAAYKILLPLLVNHEIRQVITLHNQELSRHISIIENILEGVDESPDLTIWDHPIKELLNEINDIIENRKGQNHSEVIKKVMEELHFISHYKITYYAALLSQVAGSDLQTVCQPLHNTVKEEKNIADKLHILLQ